ncbi:Hypothetical Protein FCC1311_097762 [Hondaea fermentalgiana]|uniref:Uncharacterized protein n=1 Tax=Hondaea fermentalgiana TaxID=2315210 RepID=A0A2R5GXW4_9STRA|nr:Hypothetical Protein FCC1311_097762 [Hondaea fermentalgiana]|eukprot:GBG33553.1 Hypothetical Protein FCC1311_097762 [Hondaea fermentalgiana]
MQGSVDDKGAILGGRSKMSFVAPRNVTSTVFLEDMAMPDDFRSVYVMSLVLSALGMVHGAICTRIVWRAYNKAVRNVSRVIAQQTLRDLLGLMVSSMLMNGANFALSAIPYSWRACAYLGGVPACTCAIFGTLPPSVYAISHFFCYRVLALRAMVVQELMPKWYRKILVLVRVAMFGIFPLDILSYVAFSGKLIFADGICIMDLDESLPLCLAVVDSTLSGTLLFLFVYPVSKGNARRAMRELMGQVTMALLVPIWATSLILVDGQWQACAYLGTIGGSFYVMQHFFCYRVLAVRAESVLNVMPRWYALLLRAVWFCLYGCYIVCILTYVGFSGKLYFKQEYCAVRLNRALPLLLGVIDCTLSITLLMLFVLPVLRQAKIMREGSTGDNSGRSALTQVARRNLFYSSVPILSTMVYLVILVATNNVDAYNDPDMQYTSYFPSIGASIDSLLNISTMLLMFRKIIFRPASGARTSCGGATRHGPSMHASSSKAVPMESC